METMEDKADIVFTVDMVDSVESVGVGGYCICCEIRATQELLYNIWILDMQ